MGCYTLGFVKDTQFIPFTEIECSPNTTVVGKVNSNHKRIAISRSKTTFAIVAADDTVF
jgi:hypothetical protein